ncbi:MAG TPA: cation:proton antiporter [Kouleothrix sp.]|uniref:cation:proton antiporter n=1 Tax=Kouleothrix sp. TaxID=2779161 RepID=UPI002C1B6796|nr:cation:proton antiporter [Kouleothrix sp.]
MHETLNMLLPLAGILVGAKIAAQISHKIGMPAVFGELLLGLLLGPSLLGLLAPNGTIQLLADIGVILLMFMAGLETDTMALKQAGRASMLTAIGGVVLPLFAGLLIGEMFGLEWHHALFLGAVLTATSVSISAQTLRELGRLRSREGSTILGAAIIDDVLGVLVFALVMSLSGEGNMLFTLGKMFLFFPIAWFVGDKIVPMVVRWERHLHHREASLALLLGMVLVYAWAAEALGSVATITGAYLLGVVVARHANEGHIVHEGTASLGYGFFIPVFFINIGLQAQAGGLMAAPLLTAVLIVLAIITKIVGGGLGARLGGFNNRSSLQIGIGMVSRGEVALVIAGAGLANGLLSASLFSVLVVVTLATTLVTPPLLRMAFQARQDPHAAAEPAPPLVADGAAD